jgi:hypothetical protein
MVMASACLLMWRLGQSMAPSQGLTFMHDVRDGRVTERMFAYEVPWAIAGFVEQTGTSDAIFGGVLPLRINVLHGHLSIEGGAVLASAAVPRTGTDANFMERAQLRLTSRLAFAYWHWSNASLGRKNPGVDAVDVTVRLHAR